MTAAQKQAFANATGGVATVDTLSLAIAGILAVILLLWLAWMAYAQLRNWQQGQGDFYGMLFSIASAAVVVLLLGYFIR
ncbi:MAG: DUF3262 family protein [Gammaproteobacteria bacterium]